LRTDHRGRTGCATRRRDVRLDDGKVRVTLVEGRVAVRQIGRPNVAVRYLAPRQQLAEQDDQGPPVIRAVDTDKATRWTEGQVFFEDETLQSAVREMNRYSASKIVIVDPTIANLRINGMFRAGNQTGFVGALQTTLPVEVHSDDQGQIVVSSRSRGGEPAS
jgi:transmembrane sensor